MKSFLALLAFVMIAMPGTTSFAAEQETESISKVKFVSADPEDGSTVEKFKVIQTTWSYPAESKGPYINTKAVAVLTNAAGEELQTGKIRGMSGKINLQFTTEVTEPGDYTITIPADITMAATGEWNSDGTMVVFEGSGNEETVLHYTIAAPVPPVEKVKFVSADPEDGSTVEKFKVIQTTWSYPAESKGPYINTKAVAVLTNAAGEELQTGKIRGMSGKINLQFTEEVTEPGEYTITIPADITMAATGEWNSDGTMVVFEGTGNEETVLHYTIAAPIEKVKFVSADPEDGSTVEKFKVIQTTWSYPAESKGPYINTKAVAVLTNAAGEELQTGKIRGMSGKINLQFTTEVTEPGDYTITIPADITMAATGEWNSDGTMVVFEGSGNEETVLHYTIAAPVPPVEKVKFVSADPEDGSTVEKFKVIQTTWSYPAESKGPYINTKAVAVLTNAAGEELQTGKIRGMSGKINLQFTEEVTEPGEYTITIPADITMAATGEWNSDGTMVVFEGTGNKETVLHYTIAAPIEKVKFVSADPEDGSTVEKFKVIQTTWEYPAESKGPYINTKAVAVLTNAAGEQLQTGKIRGTSGKINLQFTTEVTEPGEYTITIPADITMAATGEWNSDGTMAVFEGTGNEETVLHYTVSNSLGVNEIDSEASEVEYFDLNGFSVVNPEKGIYIKKTGSKVEKVVI